VENEFLMDYKLSEQNKNKLVLTLSPFIPGIPFLPSKPGAPWSPLSPVWPIGPGKLNSKY